MSRYLAVDQHASIVNHIDGLGTVDGGVRLVLAPRAPSSGRFAAARALWHAVAGMDGGAFLLTRAHTSSQKAGRAFAAELLAPASGIREMFGDETPSPYSPIVDRIAIDYQVNPMVIEHQIENNILGGLLPFPWVG